MKIRKDIVWGVLIISTLFFAKSFAQNNDPYSSLIPKVQYYQYTDNKSFTLDKNTSIVCENEFIAFYLNSKIDNILNASLKVVPLTSKNEKRKNAIVVKEGKIDWNNLRDNSKDKEEYKIEIDKDRIVITGEDYGGVFNGVQTLLQLLPSECYNDNNKNFVKQHHIANGTIIDFPKYNYRGFHFDVSRTWRTKEDIYRVLEYMSYHKINKFHWHLTDDQGWRIEIKSFPLLTEKGAWRGPDEVLKPVLSSGNKRYGGFYTQQEIKDIVKFANERNIEIIPEIDLPGHSKAVAASYPEIVCSIHKDSSKTNSEFSREIWCVAKESNYIMLDSILKEMSNLFTTDILNIGGDEVNHFNWKTCPDCQNLMKREGLKNEYDLHNYFVRRLDKIVHKYGKKLAGWEEVMQAGEIDPQTLIYVWKSTKPASQAVIESHPFVLQVGEYSYFDMKQSPIERGHNWAGIVTLEKSYKLDPIKISTPKEEILKEHNLSKEDIDRQIDKYLLGVQGGLWEELGINPKNFYDYQYFPRMLSIAEIGWGTENKIEDREEAFKDFNNRIISYHYDRMNNMGIKYRVPYPIVEAKEIGNDKYQITATPPFNNADIRYAVVKPQTEYDGIRGINDTTNYKFKYTEPIITSEIANYRFATFTSDTLHSIGVAVSNMPIHKQLKPKFEVETNLTATPEAIDALKDYNPKTLCRFRNRIKSGDYINITFEEPIQCSVIDIITARPPVDFYGIVDGYVEYSSDGVNFYKGGDFIRHRAVTEPKTKVKYLRIKITGDGDSDNIYLNDLIIY